MATNVGKVSEYVLPAHWASGLINDDWTEYSDEEEAEIAFWLEYNSPGYCSGCTIEPEFCKNHDGGTLAADCLTFTFIKPKE